DTLDISINLHPKDFSINPRLHETLTLPTLNTHIESLRNKGADNVHIFLTEKYVRYMTPFAALILTFMGVVVAARKSRGGMGPQLAAGFILACTYIACFFFAKGYAEAKGTQLLLTVWTPNIIFSAIGIILYRLLPQ
ncbi:MAG: LptF/LptG family permease, partial [Bacteroidota bacterium]